MTTDLPSGWAEATLDQVSQINPPGAATAVPDHEPVTFVPMAAVEELSGRMRTDTTKPFGEVKKGFTRFRDGDVLFAKITPCMENGKIAVARGLRGGVGCGSTEFHVLRPYEAADAEYLRYFLVRSAYRRDAQRNMQGAVGQQRVPTDYLRESVIPLPPKAEQQRIVSRIEELFSEIDEGERALERVGQLVERYRQSVLKAAVTGELTGELGASVAGWRCVPLGDLCTLVTSGSRGWSDFYADDGPTFIRAQNIKRDVLDLTDIAHVNLEGVREGLRTRVAKGDLLVTITGANVTKTAYVDADLSEAYVSQHVALIRVQDAALARYLYYWLISPANGRAQLLEAAYGAGKPGLSLKDLRDLVVPVPPPEQCVRIADLLAVELSGLESIVAQRRAGVASASTLRQSILKAAFSGQLVPQDPRDEPASALLARLAAQAAEAPAAPRRRGRPAGRRLSQPNPAVAE
jgi:type I restriction enzyme, S subunit